MIHEHFVEVDVQLSVASLPWFMSLFISSMPMVFAFRLVFPILKCPSVVLMCSRPCRIVDCFFLMGPKVLFQVGLAILKINGEELMASTDDGMFIRLVIAPSLFLQRC